MKCIKMFLIEMQIIGMSSDLQIENSIEILKMG